MASPYLGEIRLFAGTWVPKGWAPCNGQTMSITQYPGLYALLGLQFGGDGKTTFGLPDYRGRIPVGQGQGPGLSSYYVGKVGGEVSHKLLTAEMTAHGHYFYANNTTASMGSVSNNMYGAGGRNNRFYGDASTTANYAANTVGQAGNDQPHENRQSFLTLNYAIALVGIYPPRP